LVDSFCMLRRFRAETYCGEQPEYFGYERPCFHATFPKVPTRISSQFAEFHQPIAAGWKSLFRARILGENTRRLYQFAGSVFFR
jgi:hypothetical protein